MSSPEPQIGYEQARQQLQEVVTKLESGGVPLAESMQLWERGEQLAAICQQWLDGAKAKVEAPASLPAQRRRNLFPMVPGGFGVVSHITLVTPSTSALSQRDRLSRAYGSSATSAVIASPFEPADGVV